MATGEGIDGINGVKKVSRSVESFQRILEKHAPNREHFDALMQNKTTVKTEGRRIEENPQERVVSEKRSLMDEVSALNTKVEALQRRSVEDIVAQAGQARDEIQRIRDKLQTPGLQMRSSVQHLLKNKLGNIQDNLQVAFDKAGLEFSPAASAQPGTNPVTRFLDLLADSSNKIANLSDHIEAMGMKDEEIQPAILLAVQMKVHNVQQNLEFFTSLMNQTIQSTKTLMNVQV